VRLSDDKISHLTHLILKGLVEKEVINKLDDDASIRREIRRIIERELRLADSIDESVRRKLQSYSKKIYEGSSEWDILYNKFFEEETAKKGRG